MNLRNKVQLIGNLGNDPKITNLENNSKVVRFSLATNDYYYNAQGEKIQITQWHQIVAWNKTADIIENYTYKGKEIAIEGKLISRSYNNEVGVRCYVTEVVANEVLLLGGKEKEETTPLENIELVPESVHTEKAEEKKETPKTTSRKKVKEIA